MVSLFSLCRVYPINACERPYGILIDNGGKTLVMLDGQQINQRSHFGYMTGLLCTEIGLQPVGREMLAAADRVAETTV